MKRESESIVASSSTSTETPLCYVHLNLHTDGGTASLVGGSTKKRKEQHVAPWEVEHTRVHASLRVLKIGMSDERQGAEMDSVRTVPGASTLPNIPEQQGATNPVISSVVSGDETPIPYPTACVDALEYMIESLLPALNLNADQNEMNKRKAHRDRYALAFMHWLRSSLTTKDEEALRDGHHSLSAALRHHRARLDGFLHSLAEGESLGYVELFAGCGGRAVGYDISNERAVNTDLRPWRGVAYEERSSAVGVFNRNVTSATCVEHRLEQGGDGVLNPPPRWVLSSLKRSGVLVLSAGPPCQPFASFGKGDGSADSRDGFPALLRAIEELQPPFVEIENVMGLVKHPSVLQTVFWRV